MIVCRICGKTNGDNNHFCNGCGAALSPAGMKCPRCSKVNSEGVKFCVGCGYSFLENQSYPSSQQQYPDYRQQNPYLGQQQQYPNPQNPYPQKPYPGQQQQYPNPQNPYPGPQQQYPNPQNPYPGLPPYYSPRQQAIKNANNVIPSPLLWLGMVSATLLYILLFMPLVNIKYYMWYESVTESVGIIDLIRAGEFADDFVGFFGLSMRLRYVGYAILAMIIISIILALVYFILALTGYLGKSVGGILLSVFSAISYEIAQGMIILIIAGLVDEVSGSGYVNILFTWQLWCVQFLGIGLFVFTLILAIKTRARNNKVLKLL